MINEDQNDDEIQAVSRHTYKKHIKSKIRAAAFAYLKCKQQLHSKVKHIYYEKLEIQKYMTSPLFSNDEVDLLHALRSRSIDCKANFKRKYTNDNLLCSLCNLGYEDQPHILHCKEILKICETNEISQSNVKQAEV